MNVHLNAWQTVEEATKGELSLKFLKKYISYCRRYHLLIYLILFLVDVFVYFYWKLEVNINCYCILIILIRKFCLLLVILLVLFVISHCGPRLTESAAEKLMHRYVIMRGGTREAESHSDKRLAIPITVR